MTLVMLLPEIFSVSIMLGLLMVGCPVFVNLVAATGIAAALGWKEFPMGLFLLLGLFEIAIAGFAMARRIPDVEREVS
jgi:hypothetical protein